MFEQVKQEIDNTIKTNGNNEITATRLNGVLQDMMDAAAEEIENVAESVGDQVEANPTGEATTPLTKIKIGETIYKTNNPFSGAVEATDAERLQALANVSNQNAGYDSSEPPVFTGKMGYVVLQPEKAGDATTSFAAQITNKPNTIFEIRDVYTNVGDENNPFEIPLGCTLKFNGGVIKSGVIAFNNTRIDGDAKFENCVVSGSVKNTEIYVDWFAEGDGVTDDSQAILNAVALLFRNGGSLVFGKSKTYIHGDGLNNDDPQSAGYGLDPDKTKFTGYTYETEKVGNVWHVVVDGETNPSSIGRDIMIRFIGYDNLIIEGNGATIKSNPNNGICRHNAIMFFGACNNVTVRNLILDGQRAVRTNLGENWKASDWSNGSWGNAYSGYNRYDVWRSGEWIEPDNEHGYNLISSLYVYGCNNVTFDGLQSTNPIMDGLQVNKSQNYTVTVNDVASTNFDYLSHNITVKNSRFSYSARSGITVSQCVGMNVVDSEIRRSGYYDDEHIDNYASGNHQGIDSELESDPLGGFKNNVVIDGCRFYENDENGCLFSYGTQNSVCKNSTFIKEGFSFAYLSGDSGRSTRCNTLENCTFINGGLGIMQNGASIVNNRFYFDKDYRRRWFIQTSSVTINEPILFKDNIVECNLDSLTVVYNDKTYLDATKLEAARSSQDTYWSYYGLGSLKLDETTPIKMIGNTFQNICPYQNSGVQHFFMSFKTLEFRDNTIKFDTEGICYHPSSNDATVSYSGIYKIASSSVIWYDNNLNNINDTGNSIPSTVTFNTPSAAPGITDTSKVTYNFNKSGITSERPFFSVFSENFIGYRFFDKSLSKETIYAKRLLQYHENTPEINETVIKNSSTFVNNPFANGSKIYVDCYNSGTTINTTSVVKLYFVKSESDESDAICFSDGLIILPKASSPDNKPHAYGYYGTTPDPNAYTKIKIVNGASSISTVYTIYDAVSEEYYDWVYCNGFSAVPTIGNTASRPTGKYISGGAIVGDLNMVNDLGFVYYDMTLGKPVYALEIANDGTVTWVDASGNTITP